MNENLNLVEILKDCPEGTKLYSTVFGEVEFESINDIIGPIVVTTNIGDPECFTADGKMFARYNGECVLFPSKEQRDWSKFNVSDKIEPKFNVGDWVVFLTSESVYQVEKKENYEYTLKHIFGGSLCLSFSDENLIREWTIQDAKDGDVLVNGSNIFIFHFINNRRLMGYCHVNMDDGNFYNDIEKNECFCTIDAPVTPATKEQRDALMKAMNDAGYEWNAEKKELKKDVKPDENLEFSQNATKYRIKSEPKYRPFKNAEECFEEMQKHQPFGWVKNEQMKFNIVCIRPNGTVRTVINNGIYNSWYSFKDSFRLTFIDGTPFGIKE